MANRWSRNLTLKDIFNDKKLYGKLPLMYYKEKVDDEGKTHVRTRPKTINTLVFDVASTAARRHYKPFVATRSGNTVTLGGTLISDYDEAYDAVYNGLKAKEVLMKWTVNDGDLIRSALKEGEKSSKKTGYAPKLMLRVQSLAQIEGMSRPQLQALLQDIEENILYSGDFPETMARFGIKDKGDISGLSYEQRRLRWKYKVGDFD